MGYTRSGYEPRPWVHHWEETQQALTPVNQPLGGIIPTSRSEKQLLLIALGVAAVWFVFFREKSGRTLFDKWSGKRKNPRRYRKNPASRTICSYVGDADAQLLGEDAMARERLGLGLPVRRASDRVALMKSMPGVSIDEISKMLAGKPANREQRKSKPSKSKKTEKATKPKKSKKPSTKKSRPADRRKPRNKKGGWKNKTPACRVHLKGDKRRK